MSVAQDLNMKIHKLWVKRFNETKARIPQYIEPIETEKFVTVGINPSYNSAIIEGFLVSDYNSSKWNLDDFQWTGNLDAHHALSLAESSYSRDHYDAFFKRPREIAKLMGTGHVQLDVYHTRETSQKKMRELISQLPAYAKEEEEIFLEHLAATKPVFVLVANSYAGRKVHELLKPGIVWDDEFGCYRAKLDGHEFPVLFSRPLSGTGTIDSYGYERLLWIIKRICNAP